MTDTRPPGTPGPKGITDEQIIEALEKNGGVLTLAASALGVRSDSLGERVRNNPTLKAVRDRRQEEVADIAEGIMIQSIVKDKNRDDARWWLERRRSKKFGHSTAITGANGEPLFDVDAFIKGLSDANLAALHATATRNAPDGGEGAEPSGPHPEGTGPTPADS